MRNHLVIVLLSIALMTTTFAADGDRAERPAQPDPRQAQGHGALPEGVKVERDVEYVAGGGKSQSLDLYLPERIDKPLPVIVWIHGGGWSQGDKASCPAVPMVIRGYVVASLNYRLSQQAIFPAQIQDCQAAIRWLRANSKKYNIDPDHVGVWGSSAGGHLVALVGTAGGKKTFPAVGGNDDQSDRVQAVCDWFGPTDLTKMDEQALPTATMRHNAPDSPESRLLGGPVQDNKDKAEAANPIHYVSKENPPFLIMHGTVDNLVPPAQSDIFAEALKKAGVEVLLQKLPGSGHGGAAFSGPASRGLVEGFFDKQLKGLDVKVEVLPQEALAAVPGEHQAAEDRRIRAERGENRPADAGARAEARPRNDVVTAGPLFENLTGITEEQKAKLIEIRKKYQELYRHEHEELMAVLTDAQREEFQQNAGRGRRDRLVVPREGNPEAVREGAREKGRGVVFPSVQATITKVEVPNIWIQPKRDTVEPIKVSADENTVITLNGKPATFADLKVGQHVTIEHPTGTAVRIEATTDAPAPAPAPAK